MSTRLLFGLLFLATSPAHAQELYFPPLAGDAWETIDPTTLGWCPERIDSLYDFLDTRHTKAFLLLKDGRIVLEHYFGTFTADSLWYWASAGKTLTSTLVGIAQEEGHLDISAPTSTYLGAGWTSASPGQEELITVRHQLTMTTGLDDAVADPNCTDPACLQPLADAGTRWAYHNAPYTLLDDVIANATGIPFPLYFNSRIRDRTGMDGFWFPIAGNNVYFSRARSMARYGLLALNGMVWDQDTLLHDAAYFAAATSPSQALNESYGYLWWLNGQPGFMLPALQFVFDGPLMPHAPQHLFCALGKNDQLLNVAPEEKWVLVRLGDPAYTGHSVAIELNDQIWAHLPWLVCGTVGVEEREVPTAGILSPNPCTDRLLLSLPGGAQGWRGVIVDATGRSCRTIEDLSEVDVSTLAPGAYRMLLGRSGDRRSLPFIKQ